MKIFFLGNNLHLILVDQKFPLLKKINFLFILYLNFQQFQKLPFRDVVVFGLYDGKCPFFKFIDKILGTDTQSKDYTKK